MNLLSILLALLFINPLDSDIEKSTDILGTWITADGESHVEIFREDGAFKGKIAWLKNPYDKDGKPVQDDKGAPILNMVFMTDFQYKNGAYVNGKVYDPESGKTYYGSMELADQSTLKLRGSLDKSGWLGRTETWKRFER